MSARRIVLLDRDGTIIEERGYLADADGVVLLPGAAAGLRRLSSLGLGLVVLSNQSGIGRGLFSQSVADLVDRRFRELLAAEGVALDGTYYCPHRPEDGCRCRKPATGMVEAARADHAFDPARSIVIGDKAIDMALGRAIGAATILVRTGYGKSEEKAAAALADHVADDLRTSADIVADMVTGSRHAVKAGQ